MRSHIVEVAASGDIGLQSPGQWLVIGDSIEVGLSGRFGITYLHIDNLTYLSAVHYVANLLEIRQIAAIVGTETGHAGLLADAIDTGAVLVACGQRFLYIYWFAGLHGHDGISGMA